MSCIFGAVEAWRDGMVYVLRLCIAIANATLHVDNTTQSLKMGVPGVKGVGDICCVPAQCA